MEAAEARREGDEIIVRLIRSDAARVALAVIPNRAFAIRTKNVDQCDKHSPLQCFPTVVTSHAQGESEIIAIFSEVKKFTKLTFLSEYCIVKLRSRRAEVP